MHINFEIIYTDEDNNYFRSNTPPGYLPYVFAELKNVSLDDLDDSFWETTKYSYDYSLQADTKISDLLDCYLAYLGCDRTKFYYCSSMIYIPVGNDIVHIPEYHFRLSKLFDYYGPQTELTLFLVFSVLQGDVWREGRIRYYMNSHEAAQHNSPHVHVMIGHDYEASIGILNADVLAGELPPKFERQIKKKITDNKRHLLICWNEMTDGMHVDINYLMGETQFINNTTFLHR